MAEQRPELVDGTPVTAPPSRTLWQHCGTCDAGRDVLGTALISILPTLAVRTPPHHTYGSGPVPCSGWGLASPRAPHRGTLSTSSRRPGPPPSRGPGSPRDSWTSLVHAPALRPGGPGPPRALLPLVHEYMQDPDLQGPRSATTPHLKDCTPYSNGHAACWDWQDAGAISARPRTISTTTTTPDAILDPFWTLLDISHRGHYTRDRRYTLKHH